MTVSCTSTSNVSKRAMQPLPSWSSRPSVLLAMILVVAVTLSSHIAHAANANVPPPLHYDFDALLQNMHPCNNALVRDMPGGPEAVLRAGRLFIETMRNNSDQSLDRFANRVSVLRSV